MGIPWEVDLSKVLLLWISPKYVYCNEDWHFPVENGWKIAKILQLFVQEWYILAFRRADRQILRVGWRGVCVGGDPE